MNDRPDENLVTASRMGDRNAYATLVRRHYKDIFLVCLGILGNAHDAEDIAQDAMLKAFEQIRKLRDGAQFGRWVAKIAKNLCLNLVRRRKYAKTAVEQKALPSPVAVQSRSGPPSGHFPSSPVSVEMLVRSDSWNSGQVAAEVMPLLMSRCRARTDDKAMPGVRIVFSFLSVCRGGMSRTRLLRRQFGMRRLWLFFSASIRYRICLPGVPCKTVRAMLGR